MIAELQHRPYTTAVERFLTHHRIFQKKQSLHHVSQILECFSVFPYENISKILLLHENFDKPIHRDPEKIISDHEHFRLGGTCFSLTFFLKRIMEYFDYDTDFILADMKSGDNSHTALRLNFNDGQYLLDPGYLLTNPLRIDQREMSRDAVFLVAEERPNRFALYTYKAGNNIWRYSFLNRAVDIDDYLSYWNRSFHWMTMHGIVLSRKTSEEFLYIHNNYLKKESKNEKIKGEFNEDLSHVIKDHFGIPRELVQQAKDALLDNLYNDKELGYRVPDWVE